MNASIIFKIDYKRKIISKNLNQTYINDMGLYSHHQKVGYEEPSNIKNLPDNFY